MAERKRGADNGKYALVTYLVKERGLTVQQIIDLRPKEALDLFSPDGKSIDGKSIMEELKKYMSKSIKSIKEKQYFFPGKSLTNQISPRALLHELHFWLQERGSSLADLGLRLRQADKKDEPEEDVLDWAKKMLEE